MRRLLASVVLAASVAQFGWPGSADAARISDISNTKHNFSATVTPSGVNRAAQASNESQICAFCHTPHHGTAAPRAPIWNRQLSPGATYIPYASSSIDATDLGQPGGKSKLCLSCHDGTLALGSVNVLNRARHNTAGTEIDFTGSGIGAGDTIPTGLGETTGFTRKLGVDLSNDHPISFTFDSAQALRDGELYDPTTSAHLANRVQGSGQPPLPQGAYLPLEDDKVECISCHDPHIRSDVPGENIKFLRVNRFQQQAPLDGSFDANNDIICLGCHDKDGWVGSAHAHPQVADERYADAAADLREFPRDMRVWQAACLNCHDPHTVQGSRRILREGTDGPLSTVGAPAGSAYRQGGQPAVEEVCWACHSDPAKGNAASPAAGFQTLQGQIVPSTNFSFEVPDIKTDFTTMARHMPIQSSEQAAGMEIHDIGTGNPMQGDRRGQDFIEDPQNLGKGNLSNRHAECTDCHNPHRVMKNRLFNADNNSPNFAGSHAHNPAQLGEAGMPYHTNVASGVLRGIWGVEPIYGSTEFGADPVTFEVKRGDPAPITGVMNPSVNEPYLTREYQLCFKCHSNYTYNQPPLLGYYAGGTAPGTNSMTQYTNQAMEYQSPDDHKGEGTSATPSGAFAGPVDGGGNTVNYATNNHRSWHPVTKETGRTQAVRGADGTDWRSPFDLAVGVQTMYCSDCHGSQTGSETAEPNDEDGYPWGPHGSDSNFLLKGDWSKDTGELTPPTSSNHLCFKCHDFRQYGRSLAPPYTNPAAPDNVKPSGFKANAAGGGSLPFQLQNLHVGHSSFLRATFNNPLRCTYCHVAVPHGWKNKVFLANLNDVGLEAALPPGTQVRYTGYAPSGTGRYYQGPYYNGAALKVDTFARSGQWQHTQCGSAGPPGNGLNGVTWMSTGSEACTNLP